MGLTPSALGAGIEIQCVLPGKAGKASCTKLFQPLCFQIQGRQCSLGFQIPEEDVGCGGNYVQVLTVAKLNEKREHKHKMGPEKDAMQHH